jgi:hypothetical protein
MPGKIADYRVTGYIGRGRLGTVYQAQDERMDRTVALKVLVPPAADDGFRIRFLRESEVAATVGHPGIIPVYEVGDAGQNLFIAMHYAQGGDAWSLMHRAGPLSPAAVWGIIAQVAAALDAAHANGLVHGDVKPSNMLLGSGAETAALDSDVGQVYLSDFGMGPALQPGASPSRGQHATAASYDYLAPEQATGQRADGRADLYSLACASYELLCGVPPFGRDQGLTARYAHLHARPPTVTAQRPDLPADVDIVLATALAKDPVDRYPACTPFAEALRTALRRPARGAVALTAQGGVARRSGPARAGAAAARSAAGEPGLAAQPVPEAQPAHAFVPVLVGPGGPEAQSEADGPQPPPGPGGLQLSSRTELPRRVRGEQRPGPGRVSAKGGANRPDYPGAAPFPGDDEPYPGPGRPYRAPGGLYVGPSESPGEPTRQFAGPGLPPASGRGGESPGSADWFGEPGEPQQHPGPDEPFSGPVGWFREPADPVRDQSGWYSEPAEQYDEPAGRHSQAGSRPGGRRLVLAATAVTVIAVGVIVGVALSRSTSGPQPSTSPPPGSAPPPTTSAAASGQATAINNLLSSSSAARNSLPGAVSDVLKCTNLPGAVADFQAVVNQRSTEVSKASALSVSAIVNGAVAKSDLLSALRTSLAADRDYLSWAQQESSGCTPGGQTAAHQAALAEDSQATNAKQAFVGVWNPIAASYNLPQQSDTSF